MRKWFKYFLVEEGEAFCAAKDITFAENAKTMAYDRQEGYSSRGAFIKMYFEDDHVRLKKYDEVFKSVLLKGEKIFSIASGRCVNEILLIEAGYNILCSDLEPVPKVKEIFSDLHFVRYDVTKGPYPDERFDAILAIQVLYLFDPEHLENILKNLKASLKEKGRLIIDISGAQDNFLTYAIDNCISWYEAYLKSFILKCFKKRRLQVKKKHHGFRYTDKEFIALVETAGFKFSRVYRADYRTELERSYIIRRLAQRGKIFRGLIEFVGRAVPYLRIFIFVKDHESNSRN